MQRRRIYLVRHGEVDYFSSADMPEDPALTETGVEQAQSVGKFLKLQNIRPDLIISTGYQRSNQTAEIIRPYINTEAPLLCMPELGEIRKGNIESLSREELYTSCFIGDKLVSDTRQFMNGEPIADFTERVYSAIENIRSDKSWNNALIVAHGGTNTALISRAILGHKSSYLASLEQDYACLNILEVGDRADDWVVKLVNYTHYGLSLEPEPTTLELITNRILGSKE